MSSRFPPNSNSDLRCSRDRSPARPLDVRRPSAQHNDGPLPSRKEGGYLGNDSYGYAGRGSEPAREPPKGPKADLEGPKKGGYLHRGRGTFPGRGDARERDFRDSRDEPFGRGARGRGQNWGPRERFDGRDRRPSPVGRDRSRSPLSRDFARDTRDFAPRDEPRRDPRDAPFLGSSDSFALHGRGAFRGRARGEWRGRDDRRGGPFLPDEREPVRPRSRSRDRDWEEQTRDDRDRERDLEYSKRDGDLRKEREERDDRFRREQLLHRPDSRNSTGGVPTPLTSRSTSTASLRQSNLDRYTQNARDNRDSLSEYRPRAQGSNIDLRMSNIDSERGDTRPRSAGNDRYDHWTASPPPQAPPVPAFGSIPQRAITVNQASPAKPEPSRDQSSPLIHPSRLSLLDSSIHVPSAPKAQTLNAPTAPKAQQASERWQSRETSDRPRSLDGDASRFGSHRQSLPGAPEPIRNISRRFSQSRNDYDTSPIRPASFSATGPPDSAQPSVRKAVEEQGRNGNAPPTGGSSSMLRPPLGDMSNQRSPVKIPTGPRAERAPPSIRQPAPSIRGGVNRGAPSMMQRPGRGAATWAWVNPALPKHVPRGPSIMNTVPTKRDSIGDDKARLGPPTAESTEDAVAKWKRDHAPPSIITARTPRDRDQGLTSPRSVLLMQCRDKGPAEDTVKTEDSVVGQAKFGASASDEEKDGDEADEIAVEDDQIDWGEEDFAKDEKKFELDMQALEARRPPTPRSNPVLLNLLEELDALASALEENTEMAGQNIEPLTLSRPGGLPSPEVDEEHDMNIKREFLSPPPAKRRPDTPPLESLPFLISGIQTPFSEIEDLQENAFQATATEDAIRQRLEEQATNFEAQMEEARDIFVCGFSGWKENIKNIEAERRRPKAREEDRAPSPIPEETPTFAQPTPVLGRRIKNATELDYQEAIRISQETAAREEQARREQEPVYIPPETCNPEREAVVPAMLSKEQREAYMFTDTNTLVDPDFALEALGFTPRKDDFTDAEHETFLVNYVTYPKRFGFIADALKGRDYRDCVQHYYLTKLSVKYKDQEAAFLKTRKGKKHATSVMRAQIRPRATGLINSFDGILDMNSQAIALTEKGRPRRAAAPTFGDVVDAEPATTPAATPARRGAAGRELLLSAERPSVKRTRTKEKSGRRPKAPLLAAAPGPSPQKGVIAASRGLSSEPVQDKEQRLSKIEGAQALAGLGSQPYTVPVYQTGLPHGWHTEHQAITADPLQQPSQQYSQDLSLPPPPKAGSQPTTSSYWSVPEVQDFHNYARYFGTNWQEIAVTMKTKTPTMVSTVFVPLHLHHITDLVYRSGITTTEKLGKGRLANSWSLMSCAPMR